MSLILPMRALLCLLVTWAALPSVWAEDSSPPFEGGKFFRTRILPILERRCFECHSQEEGLDGGLALDTRKGWETGGDHGPAIKPRDLKNSPLIQAIRHLDSDSAMPPDEKMSPLEIALLETWVLLGAPDPRDEKQP